jgi:hypothetical protein
VHIYIYIYISIHIAWPEVNAAGQALYAEDALVDRLISAVGSGTSSCTNASGCARASVYSAQGPVSRSLIQLAKAGNWGLQAKNTESQTVQLVGLFDIAFSITFVLNTFSRTELWF